MPLREIPDSSRFKAPKRKSKSPKARNYPAVAEGKPQEGFIIAIDPGWTTGIAIRVDGELETCTANGLEEVLDLCEGATQIIIEKFSTAGRLSGPGLDTIELVGGVRGFCIARNIPLTIQMPTARWTHMVAAARYVGKNNVIKPSKVAKHEQDALAHLLHWEYVKSH